MDLQHDQKKTRIDGSEAYVPWTHQRSCQRVVGQVNPEQEKYGRQETYGK
jgi:hypothetical protein